MPVRHACQAVRLSRAAYYPPPRSQLVRDAAVVTALNKVVARHSGWGFWKCFYRLRRAGHRWNQASDVGAMITWSIHRSAGGASGPR